MSKNNKNNTSVFMDALSKTPKSTSAGDLELLTQLRNVHDEALLIIAKSNLLSLSLSDCTEKCINGDLVKSEFISNLSNLKSSELIEEHNSAEILSSLRDLLSKSEAVRVANLPKYRFTPATFQYCAESISASNPKLSHELKAKVSLYYKVRNQLITPHFRLVRLIARGYLRRTFAHTIDDLTSSGTEGLIKAADKWEEGRGASFATLASDWIHQCLGRFLKKTEHLVQRPLYTNENSMNIEICERKFQEEFSRKPTMAELIAETGLSEYKITSAKQRPTPYVSFSSPGFADDSSNNSKDMLDVLADERTLPVDEQIAWKESKEMLLFLIRDSLDERSAMIILLRYGLLSGEEMRPTEMVSSKWINYSSERIRQIVIEAVDILASRKKIKELER